MKQNLKDVKAGCRAKISTTCREGKVLWKNEKYERNITHMNPFHP